MDSKNTVINFETKPLKISHLKTIKTISKFIGDRRFEFSNDGTLLLGIDSSGIYNIYDLEKDCLIRSYSEKRYDFICSDFSPDGKFFALKKAKNPSSIHIWDMEYESLSKIFQGHSGPVQSIYFASNEAIVSLANIKMSRCTRIEIKIWDIVAGRCIFTLLETNLREAKKIFPSPDGNSLVIIYPNKTQIFSVATGNFIADIDSIKTGIEEINFSPDGKKLVTIHDNRIKIINTSNGQRIKEMDLKKFGQPKQIRFLPDSNSIIFTVFNDVKFRILDIKSGDMVYEIDMKDDFQAELISFCISFDGRFLATQWKNGRQFVIIHEIDLEKESSKVFSEFENLLASGKNALKEGFIEKAYECFQKAISIEGFKENEEVLEGLEVAGKKLEINKKILIGEEHFQKQSYYKAEEIYKELLNFRYLDTRKRFFISDRLEDIKSIKNLYRFFEVFQRNNMLDIYDPLCALGVYFVLHKDELSSFLIEVSHLTKIMELPPHIWNIIGYIYSADGQFDCSAEAFKKAHSLDKENLVYYRNYAWALYYMGDYSDSVYHFKRLSEKKEGLDDILIDMAVAMTGKYNNLDQSIEILKDVLTRNPSSIRANLYLGELYAGINDFFPTFTNLEPDWEKSQYYLRAAQEQNSELFRIKSSLEYACNKVFPDIPDGYKDEHFFKVLYGDNIRGGAWCILDTYGSQYDERIKKVDFLQDGRAFFALGEKKGKLNHFSYYDRAWKPVLLSEEGKSGFNCVTFSSRGDYFASAGNSEMITIWKRKDKEYKVINSWRASQGKINCLKFLYGSANLFSCGENKTIKLWDVQIGICIKAFKGHNASITSLDISSDKRFLLSGSIDRTVKLWDIKNGECIKTFSKNSGAVTSVKFSSDNMYIFSGDTEGDVRIWEIETGKYIKSINTNNGRINNLCFSSDGKFIFISGTELQAWNLLKDRKEKFDFCSRGASSISFSTDGNLVLTGDVRGVIRIWRKYIVPEENYIFYLINNKEDIEGFQDLWQEKILQCDDPGPENLYSESETDELLLPYDLEDNKYIYEEGFFSKILKNFYSFVKFLTG